MLYQKIKVSCTDCPERFYRVMYVRKDLNLDRLGFVILCSLQCEFEHEFSFRDSEYSYVAEEWLEDFCGEEDRNRKLFTLADMQLDANDEFTMEYDTGDGWEFKIKVYKEEKEIDNTFFGTNIEAKGDRIWEDAHYDFEAYINGEELEGKPWNIPEESTPQDFDNIIDLDELNDSTEVYEEVFKEYFEDFN